MGIAMCFLWEIVFLKFFFLGIWRALRKLDDYVLRGEDEYGLRETGSSKLHDKIGSSLYPQIVYWLRVSGV